jgi:endonuclease-3
MKAIDWKRYRGPNGTRRRILALENRLEREYGTFVPKRRLDPVDELILTVLSQNTNDLNSDRAFGNLRKRFPTWQDVLDASAREIEREIRVGGLARNKSKAIRKILGEIRKLHGGFNLSHLGEVPMEEAIDELLQLPSVGLKTASCVLLFSFGRPSMPVDTHVHRLSGRLGLASEKATPEQTYHVLMAITPEDLVYPFHLNLIQHGRTVCKARNPNCPGCVLRDLCPSASKSMHPALTNQPENRTLSGTA